MNTLSQALAIPHQGGVVIIDQEKVIKAYMKETEGFAFNREIAETCIQVTNELLASGDLCKIYLGRDRIVQAGALFGAWLEQKVLAEIIGEDNLKPGSAFMSKIKTQFIAKYGAPDLQARVLAGEQF